MTENGKNFPPDTIPRIEEEKRETGPPPEAPVPVPLTEAQRRFAAQYHALIYGFLLEKKLDLGVNDGMIPKSTANGGILSQYDRELIEEYGILGMAAIS